jgi:hypothetical protein
VTGATGGKRAGSRRGPRRKTSGRPVLLLLALGVTLSVVAWGYLVYAAIDFGSTARGGDSMAWWFLALASLGAVACLFFGLMLLAQLSRRLGLTRGQQPKPDRDADEPEQPRPVGGRRAAR